MNCAWGSQLSWIFRTSCPPEGASLLPPAKAAPAHHNAAHTASAVLATFFFMLSSLKKIIETQPQ
jgi:hypothetical protein